VIASKWRMSAAIRIMSRSAQLSAVVDPAPPCMLVLILKGNGKGPVQAVPRASYQLSVGRMFHFGASSRSSIPSKAPYISLDSVCL
jgi:hypothetical protein